MGSQSHPVERGRQPEASLASSAPQGRRRSVDSQCSGRVIEPREPYPQEPLSSAFYGGRADPPQRPGGIGLAGVEEHGIGTTGFPRNLGGPTAPFRQSVALRESQTQSSLAPGRRRRAWTERTQTTRNGIA